MILDVHFVLINYVCNTTDSDHKVFGKNDQLLPDSLTCFRCVRSSSEDAASSAVRPAVGDGPVHQKIVVCAMCIRDRHGADDSKFCQLVWSIGSTVRRRVVRNDGLPLQGEWLAHVADSHTLRFSPAEAAKQVLTDC